MKDKWQALAHSGFNKHPWQGSILIKPRKRKESEKNRYESSVLLPILRRDHNK